MEHEHISKAFDIELNELRQSLLDMGNKALLMIDNSVKSLLNRDIALAESTIAMDREVNAAEVLIDNQCLVLLARRQPEARDLRFITLALKIITDLERIGDKCASIAKRARELSMEAPFIDSYIDIPRMGHWAEVMLREAMDAFVRGDTDLADKVRRDKKFINELNDRMLRLLLTYIMEKPATSPNVLKVYAISRALDRIADHATNIAEMVIFMVKGQDIRHSSSHQTASLTEI
ncbi:MAG: phosphate signaling complex protein PhoU [Desulfuromonadales bacterium]|nr:phosphate signaling complex protein PhoU [Desulfuromonadales bacterium]